MTASLQYEVKWHVIPGKAHPTFPGFTTLKIRRKPLRPQAKAYAEQGLSCTKLHWT